MRTSPACRAHRGNTPKESTRSADGTKTATPSTKPPFASRELRTATQSADPVYRGKQRKHDNTESIKTHEVKNKNPGGIYHISVYNQLSLSL